MRSAHFRGQLNQVLISVVNHPLTLYFWMLVSITRWRRPVEFHRVVAILIIKFKPSNDGIAAKLHMLGVVLTPTYQF